MRSQNCAKRLLDSSCLSVCLLSARMKQLCSHWTDFLEIWYLRKFRKSLYQIEVSLKSDKNNGYFTRKPCVHLWYIAEFFLEWEMFRTKVKNKIKTHILCSITFPQKSCCLWDNVEKYGTARQTTDDNIIRRMRFACWITKTTDTHSEYVILIAFPRQQWLRERASMLRLHVHCLS
jgi:hypothetical protein